jgi:hypothetical protein
MTLDDAPPRPEGALSDMCPEGAPSDMRPEGVRGYVQFSAKVARAICARVAAGETQAAICADPSMPSRGTLHRWARERPAFAKIFARARAFGNRNLKGQTSTYCPVVAHEIATRLSEGESLTAICRDPAMPSMGTIFYWRKSNAEFAEALRLARETLAERFSDLGWEMAQGATPETAYLTRVQLGQLRWTAAILSPRTHGRHKASEPPEPPEVTTYLFRHFEIETHPETGQQRVVSYTPDPRTMLPRRTDEGPWTDPPDPVAKMADVQALIAERKAARPVDPDDPEGWR